MPIEAEPIVASDTHLRHVSCGTRAAPPLARFVRTKGLQERNLYMESTNRTDEAHWFTVFRDISRASVRSKGLIAFIATTTVADILWELDQPNERVQLVQRAVIAVIAIWLLSRVRGPNQSSEQTPSSGMSRAGHEPRHPWG